MIIDTKFNVRDDVWFLYPNMYKIGKGIIVRINLISYSNDTWHTSYNVEPILICKGCEKMLTLDDDHLFSMSDDLLEDIAVKHQKVLNSLHEDVEECNQVLS